MSSDNRRFYPIVLQFYLIGCLAFDVYLLMYAPFVFKAYCIVMLLILMTSLTNSIGNTNYIYNDVFCILDILEFFCFGVMLFSIFRGMAWVFWLTSAIVQFMYVPWNYVYIKAHDLSLHSKRKIELFSKLDLVSGLISLLFFAISLTLKNNESYMLLGFVSWVIVLAMWAMDNFTVGSKLLLPGNKILLYDINNSTWKYVKQVNVDKAGKILKIALGQELAYADESAEYYMLPGLIDSHVHIDQNPYGTLNSASSREVALDNALEALESGITTLCDMGGYQLNNYYLVNKIVKEHANLPNIKTTGCFLGKPFGHYMSHGGLIINDNDDAKRYANYLTKLGIKYVKIMLGNVEIDQIALIDMIKAQKFYTSEIETICKKFFDGSCIPSVERDLAKVNGCIESLSQLKCFSQKELDDVVKVFHEQGLIVFAHAFQEDDVRMAIQAGITRIEHPGNYSDALIALIKENGVIITSTFISSEDGAVLSCDPASVSAGCSKSLLEQWYIDTCDTLPRLYANGCKVALGTDSGLEGTPCCSLAREIISLVRDLKIPIEKVLRSATVVAAEKLGLNFGEEILGNLVLGASADFVIYDKNFINQPSAFLHPMQVWVKGRKVYDKYAD